MKIKHVTRYICDYCKKEFKTEKSVLKHESVCTANPDRICRMCYRSNSIRELAKLFPEPDEFGFIDKIICDNVLLEIRKIVEDCPACMLASMRIAGKHILRIVDFDYKKEHSNYWDGILGNKRDIWDD